MTPTRGRLTSAVSDRYRVERELGQGGMATVYLAQDLRHSRNVAIKVLHDDLGAVLGPERFLSEIRTTARLQHPHILPLLDSGEADGLLHYVMPMVTGETLRARLERERQLPVDDAIRIAREVADALHHAHSHGVIHRDIKPENILLSDGHALVADFGIALAVQHAGGQRITLTGISLGTPQYMSPEQAMGERTIDARSDIYALAAVTYEMLVGEAPFTGPSAQAIVARVMSEEPRALVLQRRAIPDHVEEAVLQGLEKIPADRFSTAAEFASGLVSGAGTSIRRRDARQPQPRSRMVRIGLGLIAAVALLAVGAALGRFLGRAAPAGPATRHWNLLLPERAPLALTGPGPLGIWQLAVGLSPAGDRLVYVAPRGGTTVLATRPLDRDSAVVIPGTEGAFHPFFSPDGRWIAYFSGNELRKIQVDGGNPVTLTTVERPSGAAWPVIDELIVFQQDGFQFRRVKASGSGETSVLLESQFGAPSMLPDGKWVVGHLGSGQLAMMSLADTSMLAITRRGVVPLDSVHLDDLLIGYSPKYVRSGHLVFGSGDGGLTALPFDPVGRRVLGGPVPVVSGVRIEEGFGSAQYDIAPDGTLIYVPGQSQLYGHLAFIRSDGGFDTLPLPRAPYTQPRLSPTGTRLAVQVRKPIGGREILIVDLATGVPERVEVEGNYRYYPAAWAPDEQVLMVGYFRPVRNVFLGARLYTFATRGWEQIPQFNGSYMSISPNGKEYVYSNFRTGDLFIRPLRGDTTSTPVPARGFAASFSPDGKWLAWGSADGSVSASPIPPTGAIHAIAERGQQPLWKPDGRGLMYRDGRRFYEVDINTEGRLRTSRPRLVSEGPFIRTFAWNHTIGADGRMLVLLSTPGDVTRELGAITGFDELLTRRAPPEGRH